MVGGGTLCRPDRLRRMERLVKRVIAAGVALCIWVSLMPGASRASGQMYLLENPTSPFLSTMDPRTGAHLSTIKVSTATALYGGLTYSSSDRLFSIDGFNDPNSDWLTRINVGTGKAKKVGLTNWNWNFRCVEQDPTTGVLYATDDFSLYEIDRMTGAAKWMRVIWSAQPGLMQVTAFAIGSAGQAYVTDNTKTGLYRLNLATGEATLLGELGQSFNWYTDLAFDPWGQLWGVRLDGGVFTIDTLWVTETLVYAGKYAGIAFAPGCYADCDMNGSLELFDFMCYQNLYLSGSSAADCDGSGGLDLFDFICYTYDFFDGCD